MNNINIYILITINVLSLTIGYILGKLSSISGVSYNSQGKTRTFGINNNQNISSISIDESKYITDLSTNNIEKKYTKIAEEIKSQDDISDSISKLKKMKG